MKKFLSILVLVFLLSFSLVEAAINIVPNGGTGVGTITGLIKGNGTSPFTAASAGTDFQGPITLTTTGSSGASTFISNVLNIPQYAGGVSSVSNSDGTLTISPTSGSVTASLALGHANTWTGAQIFYNSTTTLGVGTVIAKDATHGILAAYYNANNYAIWPGGVTPSSTNYGILFNNNGTSTQYNSTDNLEFNISDSTKMAVNSAGNITIGNLASGGTAPTTSGTTKTVITDANGLLSFIPTTSGTVTSVSGTTNRITSTGGATPVIDISATFEALLGKVASPLSQFASTTSAQLAGVISDETGSGALVFGTSPTISTGLTLGYITGSTQCLQVNSSGLISGTGSACGSGGGIGVLTVASADGSITVTGTTAIDLAVVSAPKLTTARTINGTSFDGTGNITVTAAAGTLTGTTLNSTVVSSSLTSVGTLGSLTVTGNILNSALTASKVVFTDASKNLTSTGIGTSAQFIKGDGSLDSNTYLTSSGAVTSITGTTNQVIASASTGAVTLSLPQSIATSSTPQFAKLGIGTAADANRLLLVQGDVSGGIATINRTNASTNAAVGTAIIKGTSAGDMTDGFGSAFQFAIQDNAGVENLIANIQGVRNGADNSGALSFATYLAGNPTINYQMTSRGDNLWSSPAMTSGINPIFQYLPSASTGVTASTEQSDVNFGLNRTLQFATGALTTQRAFLVQAPTYGFVGSSTITNAATVAITGAPIAGTNATITNRLALWIQNADALQLGTPGSSTGKMNFAGATSGVTVLTGNATGTGTLTLPAATDTLIGKATTDTLTNKTFNTAGTGNVFQINGTGITAVTGTGAVVLGSSNPTITLGNGTGCAISTCVSGLGTSVATALAVNVGTAGSFVVNGGVLGTPSSGTVTNLTGTASININGTVGATTPTTGVFTTLVANATTSLLLGTSGSAVGNIGFRNATSGTITLAPVTGALGTVTLSLPAATDTLVGKATTDIFTNKTLTSSTDVLGGVTMTLGSDAANDIYYRNSSGILTRLANGTTGQFLSANTGAAPTWAAPTSSTFSTQDVTAVLGNTLVDSGTYVMTSNATGTVIYAADALAASSTINIYRFVKDTSTGNYYETHTTTISTGFSPARIGGMAVVGTSLYVNFQDTGPTNKVNRYVAADLTGVTAMTISGTSRNGTMWADATKLWIYNGTSGTFDQFTISGTTITNPGTPVTFTSSGASPLSAISDGTNVWITDVGTGTINIRKYPIAGGTATSTTSPIITPDSYYQGTRVQIFMGSSSVLGIGWFFDWANPTNASGIGMHLMGITLP